MKIELKNEERNGFSELELKFIDIWNIKLMEFDEDAAAGTDSSKRKTG